MVEADLDSSVRARAFQFLREQSELHAVRTLAHRCDLVPERYEAFRKAG
jgi:hypothetical protein